MSWISKLKRFLQFHDWTWSVLLAFIMYWLSNWGPSAVGDVAMIYFAVNWIQPLISTFGIMAGLCFISRVGIWFYFKKIHRYIWGHKYKSENKFIIFAYEDFKNITPCKKLLLASLLFCFLFACALLVFLKMMGLAGTGASL